MRQGNANTDELRAAIAAAVVAKMAKKKLTQGQVAELGGTTSSKLVQYLKGRTHPPIDVLTRLAAGLGCRIVLRKAAKGK